VIFSNDVCAYSGFDGVELATGGVSGGIWLFTTRRSFFTSVWLARGDDQLVCDYLGAQCDRNEWPGEQTWDQIKLELTEEIPIRKSSRVSHTVSTGASISIHVLASNTPEDTRINCCHYLLMSFLLRLHWYTQLPRIMSSCTLRSKGGARNAICIYISYLMSDVAGHPSPRPASVI